MKRKFEHPAPSARELSGPRYWRSLDELADTPGFREQMAREFPQGADNLNGVDRRNFFKLMAASFALGGMGLASGCRRPETNILPYGKSVEGVIPGLPQYFATAMPIPGGAIPLLAETHQGRPTKLEGNPTYEPYGGATTLRAQASLLDLYDPDRATAHTKGGATLDGAAVNKLLADISAAHTATGGAGLAFLAESSTSPSRARMAAAVKKKFPQATWADYDAIPSEENAGLLRHFEKATRVVSLDADFLQEGPHALAYARDFAKARRVSSKEEAEKMNRLYMVESGFSITGSMADHRLRLASSHVAAFAAALAQKITGQAVFTALAQGLDLADRNTGKWIDECAKDLLANKGKSIVIAGRHQPAEVHAIVQEINVALGNVGTTLSLVESEPAAGPNSLGALVQKTDTGQTRTLVILGGNPAYNFPANLNFAALAKKVPEIVRVGYYVDETSQLAGTHLAAAHYLESWGDARTADGTIVPVQPMILPLFNGLTEIEILARLAGETVTDAYAIVRETVWQLTGGDAEKTFRKFLHDGLLAGSAWKPAAAAAQPAAYGPAKAPAALSKVSLEVRFVADLKMEDGRHANNGWLQECPDPITKLTWDNAILVSPKLAKELGVDPKGAAIQIARKELAEMDRGHENAFVGELTLADGKKIKGPLHIQPGLADWTVILPLGYGRAVSGHIGGSTANPVGHNFYPVRTSEAPHFVAGAKLAVVPGERYSLGTTQEHWSMEGRDLVREANVEEVTKPGGLGLAFVQEESLEAHSPAIYPEMTAEEFAKKTPEERAKLTAERSKVGPEQRGNSLYETPKFDGPHQWGMSIDLNTCIGCNACVVACQAENNIPIVGKRQVQGGRIMHWIRLDRYYSDGKAEAGVFGGPENREIPEDPQAVVQPIACQHCELAPCETVCPVNATVHDPEGINTMAYNRCIGTRYCANNCPYKVRRFNYFDFNKRSIDELYLGPLGKSGMPELAKLAKNPEVSVRMRGVMEKCTYCVQRVQAAKIAQKRDAGATDQVKIKDGAFKVACQQVCPVEAIEFGDISDPKSKVSLAKAREHDYQLLGYLNIRPRTTYLGKLRNPNPAMPDYVAQPFSLQEFKSKNHPAGHGEGGEHANPAAEGEKKAGLGLGQIFGGLS